VIDGLNRATDVLIGGKGGRGRGYGERGQGAVPTRSAQARGDRHRDRPDLRAAGGHGRLPGTTLEDVVGIADIS